MSTFYPRTLPRIFSSRIQPCSLLSCPRAHTIRLSIPGVCRIPPSRVSHQGGVEKSRPWLDRIVSQPRTVKLYFAPCYQPGGGSLEILELALLRGLSTDFHGFVTDCYVFTRCSTLCRWIETEKFCRGVFFQVACRSVCNENDWCCDIKSPSVFFDWNCL